SASPSFMLATAGTPCLSPKLVAWAGFSSHTPTTAAPAASAASRCISACQWLVPNSAIFILRLPIQYRLAGYPICGYTASVDGVDLSRTGGQGQINEDHHVGSEVDDTVEPSPS